MAPARPHRSSRPVKESQWIHLNALANAEAFVDLLWKAVVLQLSERVAGKV